jgi:phage terminase small subunit
MKEFDRKQKIADLQLTDLQKSFCEHYVEHFNANQAVRESGSITTNVKQTALDMMKSSRVLAYIEILKEYAADRVDLRLDRVLKELMRIGFSRMDHFVTWDKNSVTLRDSRELGEDDLASVSEVIQVDTKDGAKIRVKLHSKQAALEKLLVYVEGQEEGRGVKKPQNGPKQVTINNVTVRGMLLDPKTRGAFEILSNRVFEEAGTVKVPKMSVAMKRQLATLTGSGLVGYSNKGEGDDDSVGDSDDFSGGDDLNFVE